MEWNATASGYPAAASLQELFEEQVRTAPEAPAADYGGLVLTYAELDRRANRLAHRLRALGVGPESRVGLCLERSLALIVGWWASSRRAAPTCRSIPTTRASGWRS